MPNAGRARAGAPEPSVARALTLATQRPFDINRALLTINTESVGRRVVLSASGEVDLSNAADLRDAIDAVATGAFEVWLDLSDLSFMDSSGLHAMAAARLRLLEAGTHLALICPPGPIRRILRVTGLDQIFEIHAGRSAANHATPA